MSRSAAGILRAEVARIVRTEMFKAFQGASGITTAGDAENISFEVSARWEDLARLERRVEELEKGSGPPDFKAQVLEALKDPEVARAVYIIVNGELKRDWRWLRLWPPKPSHALLQFGQRIQRDSTRKGNTMTKRILFIAVVVAVGALVYFFALPL